MLLPDLLYRVRALFFIGYINKCMEKCKSDEYVYDDLSFAKLLFQSLQFNLGKKWRNNED